MPMASPSVAARDDADVAHGRGIRARGRAGQREARDLVAPGEPRQVVFLLVLGAVLLDQLAGAERVRHHDDGDDVGRARGDLADDQRLRLRREAEPAMLLGDQHAEEAVLLQEVPDGLRHLAVRMAHLPVVDHAAELLRRPVEEGLLLRCQHDRRDRTQLVPVGRAGEQLRVEADGAGFKRLRLRVGDLGQRALDELERGRNQRGAADRRHREQPEGDRERPQQEPEQPHRAVHAARLPDERGDGERAGPRP